MFAKDFPRRPMRSLIAVERDLLWQPTLALERPPEKRFGGCNIPLGAEQKIHSLSLLVDSTVKICPLAFDLHIDPMREVDGDQRSLAEWDCNHALWRMAMPNTIRNDIGAIFVSLELSRSKWLITSLSPGGGEKMSKHMVVGSDVAAMLACFAELKRKAQARTGRSFPIIVIQEAGLDGFWIHRVLQAEDIESHVVDPASIAVSRRRRRAKTDKLDGEALLRALLAYKRGEPRVCAMLRAPTPEEEDRRRIVRERKTLTNERIRHVNRVKGLLFGQGVSGYEPLRSDRRKRLEELKTGDGRPLSPNLKAQISRELDRIELLLMHIKDVEEARDTMLESAQAVAPAPRLLLNLAPT